ncbi:MAG: biotin--[acetyl-CoA-carboxylase] ligase, partial [Zoogloeaceae bacterium]|jgi:BirA family biotin operon repressor/biotin-[acetyl-CoA-carboxylase] ligase|nr:biotin--[acetyl-CoA-carboxylase] ligase [Zoogloeaceae bacterium]
VELVNAPANRMAAVIGIGLNLCAPTVPGQQTAGLADCCAAPPERHALLAALLAELARTLDIFTAEGFAALRDEWQARHLWQGRPVRLGENGRFHAEGICRGVDADGALLLETPRGLERFFAGDLSLRPATGSAP